MSAEALHIQAGKAAVARYRADSGLVAALGAATQIRPTLDTAGTPAGISALIVRARDLGGHEGMSSRKLVDVEIRVTVRTHIDEDQDRAVHDDLVSTVLGIAGQAWTPALSGWIVRHCSSADSTDVEADAGGVFRDTDVVQRLLVQAVVDSGAPVDPQDPAAPSVEVTEPADDDRITIWHGPDQERGYVSWLTFTTDMKGEPGDHGAAYGNLDGGAPDAVYGGTMIVTGGVP